VYLTYPFVSSWSLVEALSAGCYVIASRTPPVREAVQDGVKRSAVRLLRCRGTRGSRVEALEKPTENAKRSVAPRANPRSALFDLRTVCLPRQIAIWENLVGERVLPQRGQ